jgi:hypothetical protein
MSDQRHNGFVVGINGKSATVRVKDQDSPFDGQKFVVASTHDNITLAQGLNVNFLIGTVDGQSQEKIPRAVDVSLS